MKMKTGAFSVHEFAPYHFALLSSRMSKALATTCEANGLTLIEWRLLAIIASGDRLSAANVVSQSTMDPVAVHRAVMSLLKRALISRVGDEDDLRIKRLVLTPIGQRAYQDVVPAAAQIERKLLGVLSAAEAKSLNRTLQKLLEVEF